MTLFACRVTVSSPDRHDQRDVRARVNIGSAFSMLPGAMLRELGLLPDGKAHFTLPDGQRALLDFGHVRVTIEGASGETPIVFGPERAPSHVGRVTLAALMLKADPTTQRLFPTHGLLPSRRPGAPRAG